MADKTYKRKESEVTLVSQLDSKKPMYKLTGKVPKIETGIDRLYSLIREKGKIKLSDAVKKLGVSEKIVVQWGEILEDHKMIELHYPMRGKPSLRIRRPEPAKGKKEKEKEKHVKPKTPFRKRFTKKVMFIYAEIIILGELLVYIFFVNRYLAMNFLPTIQFHFNGFVTYIRELFGFLMSGNFSSFTKALTLQPMYLGFLIILTVIIILIIVLIVKSRKPRFHVKGHGEEKKREKEERKKEEKRKEEQKKEDEQMKRKKEEKKEKERKEKRKKGPEFAEIVEKYKQRLKEMG